MDPAQIPPVTSLSQEQLTEEVEKDLVQHILENIEDGTLTLDDAQKLAQEFLTLLPFQDKKDLVEKLQRLGTEHDEANQVYVKYAKPVADEQRDQKLAELAGHIKAGNIEHALTIVKGGTV